MPEEQDDLHTTNSEGIYNLMTSSDSASETDYDDSFTTGNYNYVTEIYHSDYQYMDTSTSEGKYDLLTSSDFTNDRLETGNYVFGEGTTISDPATPEEQNDLNTEDPEVIKNPVNSPDSIVDSHETDIMKLEPLIQFTRLICSTTGDSEILSTTTSERIYDLLTSSYPVKEVDNDDSFSNGNYKYVTETIHLDTPTSNGLENIPTSSDATKLFDQLNTENDIYGEGIAFSDSVTPEKLEDLDSTTEIIENKVTSSDSTNEADSINISNTDAKTQYMDTSTSEGKYDLLTSSDFTNDRLETGNYVFGEGTTMSDPATTGEQNDPEVIKNPVNSPDSIVDSHETEYYETGTSHSSPETSNNLENAEGTVKKEVDNDDSFSNGNYKYVTGTIYLDTSTSNGLENIPTSSDATKLFDQLNTENDTYGEGIAFSDSVTPETLEDLDSTTEITQNEVTSFDSTNEADDIDKINTDNNVYGNRTSYSVFEGFTTSARMDDIQTSSDSASGVDYDDTTNTENDEYITEINQSDSEYLDTSDGNLLTSPDFTNFGNTDGLEPENDVYGTETTVPDPVTPEKLEDQYTLNPEVIKDRFTSSDSNESYGYDDTANNTESLFTTEAIGSPHISFDSTNEADDTDSLKTENDVSVTETSLSDFVTMDGLGTINPEVKEIQATSFDSTNDVDNVDSSSTTDYTYETDVSYSDSTTPNEWEGLDTVGIDNSVTLSTYEVDADSNLKTETEEYGIETPYNLEDLKSPNTQEIETISTMDQNDHTYSIDISNADVETVSEQYTTHGLDSGILVTSTPFESDGPMFSESLDGVSYAYEENDTGSDGYTKTFYIPASENTISPSIPTHSENKTELPKTDHSTDLDISTPSEIEHSVLFSESADDIIHMNYENVTNPENFVALNKSKQENSNYSSNIADEITNSEILHSSTTTSYEDTDNVVKSTEISTISPSRYTTEISKTPDRKLEDDVTTQSTSILNPYQASTEIPPKKQKNAQTRTLMKEDLDETQ
ncbi:hypothetical protein JTB14_005716 [Gonioctena quinquepunctata]|nr:hypothetical protein JTB14_005716 [Gonioctena quinquepunctata]